MIQKKLLIFTMAYFLASLHSADAGKVYMVNENKKKVYFRIIPYTGDSTKFGQDGLKVAGQSTLEFEITAQDIDGKSIYSIEGEKKFGGDACFNLSVDKDYKVTFTKDKVSTSCVVEEINLDRSDTFPPLDDLQTATHPLN